ncbi:Alcohol dehydrogenase [Minicystis rosea]|nr:Alcohol dehydrogenase [Minicystis rosea]
MRTIKPFALTALNAPFQHGGKVRLVLAVGAMVSFDGTKIDHEQTLWKTLAEVPGSAGALDEIKPKVRGEALLSGYAYAPNGKPAPVVAARLSVGSIQKELWVVGDRVWKGMGPTEAIPFDRMPIDYEHAFGGEGYAANPKGKGIAPLETEAGDTVHPLPNVEPAKKLVTTPRDRPAPAGFAPIDPSWPQRIKKGGTYDKKWVETKYPEMADDFDPTYFNMAPDDQWIEGYWEGGEPFVLENMHPSLPRIEGTVPSFTARALVTRRGAPEGAMEDVALRCDTLWFLPHLERVILVFRGGIDVVDEEASDIIDVVAALERKGAAYPVEHYRYVRSLRLDKNKGALHTLRDHDLVPRDLEIVRSSALSEMDSLLAREGLPERNMRRRAERELEQLREKLRAAGVDPDKHVPKEVPPAPKTPELHELPDVVDDIMSQTQRAQAEAEAQRDQLMSRVRELCKAQGIDLDKKMADNKKAAGGPPRFTADAQIAKLKGLVEQAKAAGAKLPPSAEKLDDPKTIAKLRMAETAMKDMYLRSVHYAPPAEPLGEADSARVRRDVEATLAAGASLAGYDMTGADLSGLDFSGRDLSGAWLEKANLSGCSFRGANLERAVLARANLQNADFEGARGAGANFGEADLTGVKLTGGIDLTGVVFIRAKLAGTDLTGATLDRAELSEILCDKAIFAKVRAKGLTMLKGDLRGVDLHEAELSECNFLEVDLSGADFTGASLFRTAWVDTVAEGACFRDALLDKFRVVKAQKGSSLAGSNFRGAKLRAANLRGVNLEGVDLRETDLTQSDFSEANLRGANLEGARAVEARFMKTDLTDANLARSDLMYGLLGGAIVRGASFEEANVFRADAAKMKGDDRTSFKGANVKQVRVVPDRSGNG